MITFNKVLVGEIKKSKNSYGYLISILLPVVVTAIVAIMFVYKPDYWAQTGYNPWKLFGEFHFRVYMILYPMYVTIIAFLLTNIEHKSNGFKMLFTLPAPKLYFYLSKIILMIFWILNSMILSYAIFFLAGNLLSYFYPQIGFQNYNINTVITVFYYKMFLGCLGIVSIQFFLSIYFKNFIISVGFGFFLIIIGMLASLSEYKYLVPYSYLYSSFNEFLKYHTDIFTKDIWFSLIYSILFFIFGYYFFKRKNIIL